jgi:hypothetical protein
LFGGATSLKTISAKNWILPDSIHALFSNWYPNLSANLDWIDVTDWDLSHTTSLYALFA